MTPNEKAIIIGCHLNGASPEQIAQELLYDTHVVLEVIEEYEKNNHKVKK